MFNDLQHLYEAMRPLKRLSRTSAMLYKLMYDWKLDSLRSDGQWEKERATAGFLTYGMASFVGYFSGSCSLKEGTSEFANAAILPRSQASSPMFSSQLQQTPHLWTMNQSFHVVSTWPSAFLAVVWDFQASADLANFGIVWNCHILSHSNCKTLQDIVSLNKARRTSALSFSKNDTKKYCYAAMHTLTTSKKSRNQTSLQCPKVSSVLQLLGGSQLTRRNCHIGGLYSWLATSALESYNVKASPWNLRKQSASLSSVSRMTLKRIFTVCKLFTLCAEKKKKCFFATASDQFAIKSCSKPCLPSNVTKKNDAPDIPRPADCPKSHIQHSHDMSWLIMT